MTKHDPLTQKRIQLLCQRIVESPFYNCLRAPELCVKENEILEEDMDDNLLNEWHVFKGELFKYGFIPNSYCFFQQPDNTVAITGFESFHFKMLRPDGSWYSQAPISSTRD